MILYYEIRNGQRSGELLLEDVKYDAEGNLKSGWAVNGAWNFEIRGDEVLAKDGNFIVNRWPKGEYVTKAVPKGLRGDYNDIMAAMEEM